MKTRLLLIFCGIWALASIGQAQAQRIGGLPDLSFNPTDSGAPFHRGLFAPEAVIWPSQQGRIFMAYRNSFSSDVTSLQLHYQQFDLTELAPSGARDTSSKPLVRGFIRGFVQTPQGRPVMIGTSDIFNNTDTVTLTKSYLRTTGTDQQVRSAWKGGKYPLPLAAEGDFKAGLVRAPGNGASYIFWITNNPLDSTAPATRTVFIQIDTATFAEINRTTIDGLVVSAAAYNAAQDKAYFIGANLSNEPASAVLNQQLQQTGILVISQAVARIQPPFAYLSVADNGSYTVAGRYSNIVGVWNLNADGSLNGNYPDTRLPQGSYAFSYDNGVLRAACYSATQTGVAQVLHQYVMAPGGGWASQQDTPLDGAWGAGKPIAYMAALNAWICETGSLAFATVNGYMEPKYRFLLKSDGSLSAYGKMQGTLGHTYSMGYRVAEDADPAPSNQILYQNNVVVHNGRISPNFLVLQRNGEIDPAFTSSLRFPKRLVWSLGLTDRYPLGYPFNARRMVDLATGNRLLFSSLFTSSLGDSSAVNYPDTLYRYRFDGTEDPLPRTVRGMGLFHSPSGGFVTLTFLTASGAHRSGQQLQSSTYNSEYSAAKMIVQRLSPAGEFTDTVAKIDFTALPDSLTNWGRYITVAAEDEEGGIWISDLMNSSLGLDGPGQRSFLMRVMQGRRPTILVPDSNYVFSQVHRVEVLPGKKFRIFGVITKRVAPNNTPTQLQVALFDSVGHFLTDPEFPSHTPYVVSDAYGGRNSTTSTYMNAVLPDGRIFMNVYSEGAGRYLMFQRDGRLDPSFLPISASYSFGAILIGGNTVYCQSPYSASVNNLVGKKTNMLGGIYKNGLYAFKLSSSPAGKGFVGGKVERVASPVLPGQGCAPAGTRYPVAGTVVKAGTRVAITDTAGNYAMAVDTGRHNLSQDLPNDFLMRQVCPLAQASRPVHISRQLQTVLGQDFINESYDCPRMTLNFFPGRMRLCSQGTAMVSYRNEGTAPQPDARLRLFLPDQMRLISSVQPFTREADGSYTFPLGTVLPNQGGMFTITDSIACSVPDSNLRICYTARIEPMSVCGQIAGSQLSWDGAWVDAKAHFISTGTRVGQVRYRVVNRGQSMTDSVPLKIVTQNYYPAYSQKIKLVAGDSLEFYVNGGEHLSSQLVVGQTAGCPLGTMGSMGFAGVSATPTFLSLQDGWLGRQTVSQCFPIRYAYDPNEKTVYPEKQAEPGERLDYTIHFENYGNDTAFAVVVLDTLDANLDVTKFALEGSSHPCTVTLTGTETQPVLNFSFLPIALTAKRQDSVASKGFVKFALSLKPGVPRGTFVANRASIYFDRNPAVVTPYATIQVRPEDRVTAIAPVSSPTLLVAPNPSQDSFRVVVPPGSYGRQLAIRDVAGRLIRTVMFQGNTAEVSGLAAGMYTVQVEGLKAARVVVNR